MLGPLLDAVLSVDEVGVFRGLQPRQTEERHR